MRRPEPVAAALHYEAYFGMHGELFSWITETADRFGSSGHAEAETVLASASVGAWQSGELQAAADYSARAQAAIHPFPILPARRTHESHAACHGKLDSLAVHCLLHCSWTDLILCLREVQFPFGWHV